MPATHIIGQTEPIRIPALSQQPIVARIDTGAQTSAICVSDVQLIDGQLQVIFFTPDSPFYTGKAVHFGQFTDTTVYSSNGMGEHRYKVKLSVIIAGRRVRASFTLADRSRQRYPVLVGRTVLKNKFLVDVARNDDHENQEETE